MTAPTDRATVRKVYEIYHHYGDGSSRVTTVRLSDEGDQVRVEHNNDWLWLNREEAISVAEAIRSVVAQMREATNG